MSRLRQFIDWLRAPRFAKYRPASRAGTRQIERRLLRRLSWDLTESIR